MATYMGCVTVINCSNSRHRVRALMVLVCLALVACGSVPPSDTPPAGAAPGTTSSPDPPAPVATITVEQVLEIAQAGLPTFRHLYSHCADDQVDATGTCVQPAYLELGFKDKEELAQATLGPPYQIFALSPQMLKRYTPGTRVATLITPRAEWLVPVVANGEGRSVMDVGLNAGTWQVQGFDGQPNVGHNLVAIHNHYIGRPLTIHVIGVEQVGHTLALITEDARESLMILSGPVLSANDLHPSPPEEVMAKMLAELPDCPAGQTC